MSTFTYGPAFESELAYRRTALLRDAANHRLARQARAARLAARTVTRTATRTIVSTVTAPALTSRPAARPASVPASADSSAGPATPARQPVGCAA